jgi:hypothetical protein
MKSTFDPKRFWLLVRRYANENRKLLLLSIAAIIIPAIFIELKYSRYNPQTVFGYYIFFLLLFGTIFTSLFFKNWNHTSRTTSLLNLPSTALEKVLLVQFYAVVLFVPIFTILFCGTNLALYEHSNPGMSFLITELAGKQSVVFAFFTSVLVPYFLLQSFFLLINIWIKKSQYVIALVFILVILLTDYLFMYSYMKWLTGGVTSVPGSIMMLFPTRVLFIGGGHYQEMTSKLIFNISTMVCLIMTVLFYTASYFKLKEKEI